MKTHRLLLIITVLLLGSFALSACTGAGAINAFPGVSATQTTVYLADQGYVYLVNASNGTMTCRFPDKAQTSTPFYAPPAVTDNEVIAGNYGHVLYSFDSSCKQKWAFDSGDGHFVGGSLVINNTVLAPSSNGSLYAVNLSDGTERWSFHSSNGIWATPASDGQNVYIPALDHVLYALKLSDGSQVWSKDLGSALISAPLLTKDGTLYIATMEGDVVALKAADGTVLWTAKAGGRIWSTPVLNQDVLYVGNSSNKVSAISTKDGSIIWQKDAGSAVIAGGVATTDGVVFATEGGAVIAWSFDGQKELWRQQINGKLYTTPVVTNQAVVVAVTQGDKLMQAYNTNGQPTWSFVAPK